MTQANLSDKSGQLHTMKRTVNLFIVYSLQYSKTRDLSTKNAERVGFEPTVGF